MLKRMSDFEKKLESLKFYKLFVIIPWVIFCLALVLFYVVKGHIGYEANDDYYLELVVSGVYGKNYALNVYNSAMVSSLLCLIHQIFPGHNWSIFMYLGMILISYIVIGIVNIYKNKVVVGYLTSLVVVVATADSLLGRMNFSKSGVVAIAAGCLVLGVTTIAKDWKSKKNTILRICAYILIVWGGGIRREPIFACLPFVLLFMVYCMLKNKEQRILRGIPFIAVIAAVALVWISDSIVYSSQADWKEFREYNDLRAEITDYPIPEYYPNKEYYDELGVSLNDYCMILYWVYSDAEVFTDEMFDDILELKAAVEPELSLTQKIDIVCLNIIEIAKEYSFIYVMLLLMIILAAGNKRKDLLFQLMAVGGAFAELAYLVIGGRIEERAVFIPAMMGMIGVMLFSNYEEQFVAKNSKFSVSLMLIMVMFGAYFSGGLYELKDRTPGYGGGSENEVELMNYITSNKDSMYVFSILMDYDVMTSCYSTVSCPPEGVHDNVVWLGGWLVPSPIMMDICEKYGDKYNALKLLMENDNAYLIKSEGQEFDYLENYYLEHYGKNVEFVVTDTVGGYQICTFVAE